MTTSLSLSQSKNKVSLRNLSMVLRQLPPGPGEEQGRRVMESVDMARQAVQMDLTDGTSWCEWSHSPTLTLTHPHSP